MKAMKALLENYWIIREKDKQLYYDVKREVNDKEVKKFLTEMLGWKLIHTERVIKLEKLPSHACAFMGIQEFTEIRDYCFLCAILMFLEDKEDNIQFLLSELIQYVEVVVAKYMEVDWTSFSQRKSLVRVLQYVEKSGMLKAYEGNSNLYSNEMSSEVLYENTGLSRYFATHFSMDMSKIESWRDLEKKQLDELEEDRGNLRTNRIFRQLVLTPSLYFADRNGADASYLKTKKKYVGIHLTENMGGTFVLNKNNAALVYVDQLPTGDWHPKNTMISEIVLLVCYQIYSMAQDKRKLSVQEQDTIAMSKMKFEEMLLDCKRKYQSVWSKEYREMSKEKYLQQVKAYMQQWMMISEEGDSIVVYPSCCMVGGQYGEELEEKIHE